MPIDVDEKQRLREIAEATVMVARRDGARAITIRAVAAELGRSTTVITNYVPNRAALMVNAVRAAQDNWQADLDAHLDDLAGPDRLRALISWYCSTTGDDEVLRRMWIEMLSILPAGPAPDLADATSAEAAHEYADLAAAMAAAGVRDRVAADAIFLIIRGFFVAAIEDPAAWPPGRAAAAALATVDLLLRGQPG